MAAFDPERWRRASPHLDRILDLPAADRAACVASLRGEDPALAADVGALLDVHQIVSARRFLEDGPPAAIAPLAGAAVGAYTLVEPIGHGGMGSVWLASRNDGRFEGRVAVKLLNMELVGRAGGRRFRREGDILARLTHPHIARLIDAGASRAGQPYLVLEYVDGRHIDVYCDERALDVEARIRLFLDVLSAVSHAHANLIVHRDLKPSNVLVRNDGRVMLLDFGVAKLLDDDTRPRESTLTREACAGLTPRYAAPEQLNGGPVTTATDVYALGVLLYGLLTGAHPSGDAAQPPAQMLAAILDAEPRPMSAVVAAGGPAAGLCARNAARRATTPDGLGRLLRGDLDTIVARALRKNRDERYASVAELADDLRRVLDHQPINARPDTVRNRAARFVRRHRRGLAAGAAVAIFVGGLTRSFTIQLARERDRAAAQAARAARARALLAGFLTGAAPCRAADAGEEAARSREQGKEGTDPGRR